MSHLSMLKARSIFCPTPAVFSSVFVKAALAVGLSPTCHHLYSASCQWHVCDKETGFACLAAWGCDICTNARTTAAPD